MPADIPEPGPNEAVVSVYVGDVRTSGDTIGPLEGATFGLFHENPSADIDHHDGFTDAEPDYTCTSDAQGDCSFTVPIGEGGVPANTRLWVATTGSAGEEYANPWWQTSPLTPNNQQPRLRLRHVFQTPPLQAGQTYESGSDWITDPGQQTDPRSNVENFTRRTASGGVWPLSRRDPDLAEQCGLDVALVVDLSSSVSGEVEQLKGAMNAFVDSLRGTPSRAALFTFGTDSPANDYDGNTSLQSIATAREADLFKELYARWEDPPTNYTNWDRGLGAVAEANRASPPSDQFDLAVFITDGNPTVYGPEPLNGPFQTKDPRSGYTRFRELGNAVASANLLKSEGTRILAVGVGDGLDQNAAYNLRTVSGRDSYNGENILEADYLQQDNYGDAGTALRNVVLASCAPSVSVVKQIVPYDGTIADAYTPQNDPWDFSASTPTEGASVAPSESSTDPNTGALNFDLTYDAGVQNGSLRIEEDPRTADGYTPMPNQTECVNKTEEEEVTPTLETDTAFSVDVGIQDAVSCVVYNRAPDFSKASVQVHKQWEVTTVTGPDTDDTVTRTYANGAQPSDLQATLELDGPSGAESSPQSWDFIRDGYDLDTDTAVAVTENVDIGLPGCELTGSSIAGEEMTPGTPESMPLESGNNEWTITNEVECHSHLTLRKSVPSGGGDPQWWNLAAIRPDDGDDDPTNDALPGPNGRDQSPEATTVEVTPDVLYQLAELGDDEPHDVLHYVQNDLRSGPPYEFPNSTGSWDCDITTQPDGDVEESATVSSGVQGAIAVPLGHDATCTAVNQTAWLNIVKRVEGGSAEPDDFKFNVKPIGDTPPGGHAHKVPGSAEPTDDFTVRPRQTYDHRIRRAARLSTRGSDVYQR